MKTKFYWLSLLASAAMIAQANAGGHHGGGGGGGFAGGGFAPAGGGSRGSAGGSRGGSFYPGPMRSFGGGRMTYMGRGFSSFAPRYQSSAGFRQHYTNPNAHAPVVTRSFAPGNFSRGNHVARSANGNRAITNPRRVGNGTAQVRNGNSALRGDWRNHVFAQHSANWQRNWDRGHDHWWHGHRCHFVNGSWIIFDTGFYPWGPYWYDDYYAYGYPYPYAYDPYYDDSDASQGETYYGQNGYADQYGDSTVSAAQESLAQQGYYRGEIDGVLGPQTRRAVARYQSDQGLRATGDLNTDTLAALGLRRVASF